MKEGGFVKRLRQDRGLGLHLGVLLVAASSLSCASNRSAEQSVPVITDPSGATAIASTQRITTPGSLLVPAGAREMEIRVELKGYESVVVLLARPDSSAFADCFSHATSDSPKASKGGYIQGAGAVATAIGSAAVRAASDCSSDVDLLVPTFVFLKLQPVSPVGSPGR